MIRIIPGFPLTESFVPSALTIFRFMCGYEPIYGPFAREHVDTRLRP